MEVKAGYKQTEVGIIPEDWEVKQIGEIADVKSGGTPSTKKKEFWDGNIFWCTPTDITSLDGSKYLSDTERKITELGLRNSSAEILPKDSIVMTSRATIGECAINKIPVSTNQGFKSLIPKGVDVEFLYYKILTYKSQLVQLGSGSTFFEVSKKDIERLFMSIPPTKAEQTAIATVLSEADALINSLGEIIAKKRNIKQGSMQQLLTGKKRLPGFSGDWETKKLGELLDYEQPGQYIVKNTEYTDNGDIPVLTANKGFILGYTNETEGIYTNLPVIILDDFTTDNKYVDFPFKVKSSAIKLLTTKEDKTDLRFMFGKMQLIRFSSGDHKRHYISEYQHLDILVPDFKEQTAIAQVLSDMDAEIEALERKLEKYRLIKQGMIQELLTGQKRLI